MTRPPFFRRRFQMHLLDDSGCILTQIWLTFVPEGSTGNKPALFEVMAWCRQPKGHYLKQCWSRSPTPCGVTGPPFVILISLCRSVSFLPHRLYSRRKWRYTCSSSWEIKYIFVLSHSRVVKYRIFFKCHCELCLGIHETKTRLATFQACNFSCFGLSGITSRTILSSLKRLCVACRVVPPFITAYRDHPSESNHEAYSVMMYRIFNLTWRPACTGAKTGVCPCTTIYRSTARVKCNAIAHGARPSETAGRWH